MTGLEVLKFQGKYAIEAYKSRNYSVIQLIDTQKQ
jgi:hypothetical protein